ncbi:hypothetical protein AT864_02510 [Anoxybacillus sp. P3H1B]|jgi:Protein of unknown function (DUF1189)|uniref:DUF1189 domain-containing protein n=1 Tax=Anoxybacillaceae TaxID=3120669 RepID=UPI000798AC22|nr:MULTISPECIES: DUF1189 domain-containing protein [Anoxybacillus]KXG09280.1 hypothetical protein AT864_02510 [Anoxybacillus sp. P3H1B]QHC04012.1 DUF1189 domain-containing protein [Anoxybacillus sp. PDR2]
MNFFKKLSYSVGDVRRYPDMVAQGAGKAFLYLLLFALLFGTLNSIIVGYQFNQSIGHFTGTLESKIPEFTFQNGELNVEGTMPIVLDDSKNGAVIIDTTGQTTEDRLNPYSSGVLILKDRMISKQAGGQTQVFLFRDFQGVTFDKQDLVGFLPYLKWLAPIVAVIAWIGFFIGKIFSALFLAIINLVISKLQKANLPFGRLYSLSIYSLSLPIILDLIFKLFHFRLPGLIYYIVALVYSWLAINQIKKQAGEAF